uniref:Minor capsid protein n=1 Tax=Siphoviridae sp. ctsxw88 TaxID=2825701 RepID=A0A8S5PHE9_9CAUD|nr:MAG TPA: Minor capsid protein [Siphoviridae sp. ctsxw88]
MLELKISVDDRNLKILAKGISDIPNDNTLGEQLAILTRNYMDEYVPFDTGQLASTVKVLPWELIYTRAGVHSNYEGISVSGKDINYTKTHHPNATHHWDKAMLANKGEQYNKSAKELIMERIRRLNGND